MADSAQEDQVAFWRAQLPRLTDAVSFPDTIPGPPSQSRQALSHTCAPLLTGHHSISSQTLIHAAWAIIQQQQTNASTTVFARLQHGSIVPQAVCIATGTLVAQFLQDLQKDTLDAQPFERFGLANIQKLASIDPKTLLITGDDGASEDSSNTFPLVLRFCTQSHVSVAASFDPSIIDQGTVGRLLSQFDHVLQVLSSGEHAGLAVECLELCSPAEYARILSWNDCSHKPMDDCVHWGFERNAKRYPNDTAIDAWDRSLTYGELDAATARLATHLRALGVGPEVIVPVCFHKSAWTVVAMLAVLRAGGVYASIDPSHPPQRIQDILRKAQSKTVIASPQNAHLFGDLVDDVVELSQSHLDALPHDDAPLADSGVAPDNLCMMLFTSGSTGTPKGILLEHRNICKTFLVHGSQNGFKRGIRVLQFSAHTFDICNSEIFETLYHGGTICVPSDEERLGDLAGFSKRTRFEWSFITPSVAALLNPAEFPTLRHLNLGGELVPGRVLARWKGRTRPSIVYGPSECAIYSSWIEYEDEAVVGTIGRPQSSNYWIVDPRNHNVLAPIGAVGELLIDGPIVGRGYLDEPEKTAKAFITTAPTWRPDRPDEKGQDCRFYLSGDLVRYDPDGSFRFLGRKDTQVKLRGLRIELGDIEQNLKDAVPEAKAVVASVIEPSALNAAQSLAAFVVMERSGGEHGVDVARLQSPEWRSTVHKAQGHLAKTLPPYMVPSIFIPLAHLPMNASLKTDRRRIKELGASLSVDMLKSLWAASSSASAGEQPTKPSELKLAELWAEILGQDASQMTLDDNFFDVGGDSVRAMKLAGLAKDRGYPLSFRKVFQTPVLRDMAKFLEKSRVKEKRCHKGTSDNDSASIITNGDAVEKPVEPFSLLDMAKESALSQAEGLLVGTRVSEIIDIFPCTPFQEGIMAATAKYPGQYVSRSVFRLNKAANVRQFQGAVERLVATLPILRTRIIDLPGQGFVQVVVNEPLAWLSDGEEAAMDFGMPLTSFALSTTAGGEATYLVWTMHHAIYDGQSLRLMLETLEQLYRQPSVSCVFTPFQNLVRHILQDDKEAAKRFWTKEFAGPTRAAVFPQLPPVGYAPFAGRSASRHVTGLPWSQAGVTAATTVRTAWAILQAQYTGSSDVLFGAVMSGRQTEMRGIQRVAAPTISVVPLRVMLDDNESIIETQKRMQEQFLEMGAHEQFGLRNISQISEETRAAGQFQTILTIQPESREIDRHSSLLGIEEDGVSVNRFLNEAKTFALSLDVQLGSNEVGIDADFDDQMLDAGEVDKMLVHFEHVLRVLCNEKNHGAKTRSSIELADGAVVVRGVERQAVDSADNAAGTDSDNGEPATPAERTLQALWALVLKTEASKIGAGDNFIHFGGDSVAAIRLVTAAQKQGWVLTVADVLRQPRLRDMARTMREGGETEYRDPEPFSLLGLEGRDTRQGLLDEISADLAFAAEQIQDVFPTTDTQALCFDAAMHTPPQGCFFFHVDVPAHVPSEKVVQACAGLWELDMLRTVVVMRGGRMLQVVPRDVAVPVEELVVAEGDDLAAVSTQYCNGQLESALQLGQCYVRFVVFHGPGHPTRLAMRLSHGHFDGVSLVPILRCIAASLQGVERPSVAPFSAYVRHVQERNPRLMAHWTEVLRGSRPLPHALTGEPGRIISMTKVVREPPPHPRYTHANVFLAACSQAIAAVRDVGDVVTTLTVSGRTMLPGSLENVVGPCLSQVPLRVRLDAGRSFEKTLQAMQQAHLDVLPAELATMSNIYETCAGDWPVEERRMHYNTQFQNVGLPSVELLGEPAVTGIIGPTSVWEHSEEVWMIARPQNGEWHIALSANAKNCSMAHLEAIADELAGVVEAM